MRHSAVVRVWTLAGFRGQNNTHVFLCRRRAANIFKGFSQHSLVFQKIGKHDNVRDGVFLNHGKDGTNHVGHPGWDPNGDKEHEHEQKEEKTQPTGEGHLERKACEARALRAL